MTEKNNNSEAPEEKKLQNSNEEEFNEEISDEYEEELPEPRELTEEEKAKRREWEFNNELYLPYISTNYDKKIFSNARSIAVKVLVRCERTDAYLDKLIDAEIRNSELNDLDKALLNEIAHGVIRWLRRLDWFLNGFYRGQYEKCLNDVKNAMRVGLYQILFLNKIPYSAAVYEAVEFIKKIRGEKHAGVVNGLLRTIIRTLDSLVWPTRDIDEVNYLGIIQSHPNWMVRKWISRYGFDNAQNLCEANNRRPWVTLRINNTRISTEEFINYLEGKGINYLKCEYIDNFVKVKSLSRISEDEFFNKGYFTVQDESAGLVSLLTDPKEDEIVIDVCAAPGGKSSHLSELTQNKCQIIAIDKYLSKTEIMKKNFERLGLKNVKILHDDINNPHTDLLKEELIGKADKVLVDAPCSGLGVLSKKPDIKWKREPEDLPILQKIQSEILESASKYVKVGGALIYSTCTIEPEENSEIVKKFLEIHPEFEVDDGKKYLKENTVNAGGFMEVFPHINNTDGAFAARLIRKK